VIGVAQIATLAASSVVQSAGLPGAGRVGLVIVGLVGNVVVVGWMYRFMTTARPSWRAIWPGATAAGVAITVLQLFGTSIVTRIVEGASRTYGSFAVVLGLITWLGFIAISILMCAELNAALVKRGVNGRVRLP
jgi:uncharacterized BrkB/YihY/UPF0761 family membrane protein